MTSSRPFEWSVFALMVCGGILLACGRPQAPVSRAPASTPAPATAASPALVGAFSLLPDAKKETFGKAPCGRLLAIEEVESAFSREVPMIDVVAEGNCVYEAKGGLPVVDVKLASGPGLRCTEKDGTYMGKPAEKVDGLGEHGVWSAASGSVCFVKGTDRIQISLGAKPPEGKTSKGVAADLARKAFSRVPKS